MTAAPTAPQDPDVARAAQLDTAALSDALDRLGIVGQCTRITPRDDSFKLAGRAYTVLYRLAGDGDVGHVGDFIDDVAPGSVIAIDNAGRDTMGTWGNILTEYALLRGMAGTVIDGNCRDVALCRALGYPIFSSHHWMRTGKGRIELAGLQVPVCIGGVVVKPGDLLRGDADGVVCVPAQHVARVLDIAEDITAKENAIRQAIRSGVRLDRARAGHRYHDLQSPGYDKAG